MPPVIAASIIPQAFHEPGAVKKRAAWCLLFGMATAFDLYERNYDLVVVATGAKPKPLIASSTKAARIIQATKIETIEDIESPVIIVGGGLTGCNIALWLASCGVKNVTILEAEQALLPHNEVFTDCASLPSILENAGVVVSPNARVTAVTSDTVYAAGKDGDERQFAARSVIIACGYQSNHELLDELVRKSSKVNAVMIGTARSGSRVMDALHDAFFVARQL
jgi:2-enoate reductase